MASQEEPKFKVGDVVRLKSGGQLMTISLVNSAPWYTCVCVWFSAKGKHKWGTFKADVLEHPKAI